jgi:hypothetical protein
MSIQLNVEIREVQVVLAALAKQPFEQIADLWFKLKNQAEQQLTNEPPASSPDPQPADTPQAEA